MLPYYCYFIRRLSSRIKKNDKTEWKGRRGPGKAGRGGVRRGAHSWRLARNLKC